MSSVIEVRGMRLGEGIPKLCVPLVGRTEEALLSAAAALRDCTADLIEWRCDHFDEVFTPGAVEAFLPQLREALGKKPLLATFRTAEEGGVRPCLSTEYRTLVERLCASGCIDLVDVEFFRGDRLFAELLDIAHAHGVPVIASNHDFDRTPPKEELARRLLAMGAAGADVAKLAVMPTCPRDVLTLLDATLTVREQSPDLPVITMSMSGTGVISRLCGETFGSCLTFGAAGSASAPGQPPMDELRRTLELLHEVK